MQVELTDEEVQTIYRLISKELGQGLKLAFSAALLQACSITEQKELCELNSKLSALGKKFMPPDQRAKYEAAVAKSDAMEKAGIPPARATYEVLRDEVKSGTKADDVVKVMGALLKEEGLL